MKILLISLLAIACAGVATAQNAPAPSKPPRPTPGVLQQPRPSAGAHADARASDAYNAHRMQNRGAKMAGCRAAAAEKQLSGVELRQSLLDCMH
ncbi:MAG: hypothetical protein RL260_1601 [Pseudomonadota bacterium]|jgi:hypothetical protein|uniref:hypothetical protein n=1 Tax=Sphaerotilus sp. TaxID=2093942 RepID=UPI0025E44515|nr:hypothetical protein [Sphaerotilus sp.]